MMLRWVGFPASGAVSSYEWGSTPQPRSTWCTSQTGQPRRPVLERAQHDSDSGISGTVTPADTIIPPVSPSKIVTIRDHGFAAEWVRDRLRDRLEPLLFRARVDLMVPVAKRLMPDICTCLDVAGHAAFPGVRHTRKSRTLAR